MGIFKRNAKKYKEKHVYGDIDKTKKKSSRLSKMIKESKKEN